MKFIKEYRLYESSLENVLLMKISKLFKDPTSSGGDFAINIVTRLLSHRYSESDGVIKVNAIIFKRSMPRQNSFNRSYALEFDIDEIRERLDELLTFGYDFEWQGVINYPVGVRFSTKVGNLDDMQDSDHYVRLDVSFIYSDNMECPNPECDNILDKPGEKCTVCGE